jgi:hypothetical protein
VTHARRDVYDDDFTPDDDAISLVMLWEKQFQSAASDKANQHRKKRLNVEKSFPDTRKSSQHSTRTQTRCDDVKEKREKKFLKLTASRVSISGSFRLGGRPKRAPHTKRECEGEIEMVSLLFVFIHQHAACVFLPRFFGCFSASLPFHRASRRGRKGDRRVWLSRAPLWLFGLLFSRIIAYEHSNDETFIEL